MKLIKNKKIYIFLAILVVASFFVYNKFAKPDAIEYSTAKAEIGTLNQTVTETGSVKRLLDVNLNFLAQGRLAKITSRVGDKVTKGQILAELDNTNLKIQSRQAEAGLDIARANLQKMINGAVPTDVAIGEKNSKLAEDTYRNSLTEFIKTKAMLDETVAQAEKNQSDLISQSSNSPIVTSLDAAKKNLESAKTIYQKTIDNRISSGLIIAQDKNIAAKSALDSVNRIISDENAKDTLGVADQTKLSLTIEGLGLAKNKLTIANASLDVANKSKSATDLDQALADTSSLLSLTINTLNLTLETLINTITSNKLSQANLDSLKATANSQISIISGASTQIETASQALSDANLNYDNAITTATQNLNTAMANYESALQNAGNALSSAKLNRTQQLQTLQSRIDANLNSWQISQSQLTKITAGTRSEDISLASAQVKQAQANLDAVNNQINNTIIKAPFEGEITQVNYAVGEEPNATKPVFVLLGKDQYLVDVLIAESDIAKIAVGNSVELDFDAFGESVKFTAEVTHIDPAQTIIQEVVYYKTEVSKIQTGAGNADYLNKFRPGMTVNLTILANKKENIIIIPYRAVLDQNGQKIVRILKDNQSVEMPVKLGMRGDNGMVEITGGLTGKEELILSIINKPN